MNIVGWFTDPANWTGSGGIPTQIGYHLLYSAVALLAALAIAVPLGIVIGYTGRGEALVAGFANALRALPSLGLLVLLFLIISPVVTGKLVYVLPTIIVLVLLAVPPILTGTYAGIQNADPDAVGAARGMGFTKRQILLRVQLPCALPLMVSGVRSSTSANHFDGHHRRISGSSGSRPVHSRRQSDRQTSAKWQAAPSLSLFSQSFSSSASPGSAGSSCRRVCGAPPRNPPHPVATTVPAPAAT